MPVQLLPFQKLVDMPNMAQRYRRAICGLAIASIVLIILILSLLVWAMIGSFAMAVIWNQILFVFAWIPLMAIVPILVCTSSYISLRNTDKWASTDTCCNLTRSHPTCCTKRCASNKHCCARMSCLHIAASVWTSLFCVLLVALLVTGCTESRSYGYQYPSGQYPDRRTLRSSGCLDPSEENVKVGTHVTLIANREAFQKAFDAVPYIWDPAMVSLLGQKVTVVSRVSPGIFGLTKSDARSNQPVWYYPFSVITCVEDKGTTGLQRSSITATTTTETTPPYIHLHHYRYYVEPPHVDPRPSYYYYGPYTTTNGACQTLAWFEVPALVLMICLAITTAVSAYLLRAIEKEMPQIEPLPAGKMVVLASPDTAQMSPAPTTEVVRVAMGEGNSTTDHTTDVKTEQNV